MERLAGFRYRDIVTRLKELGLPFDRQARGSHEIWFNPHHEPLYRHPESSGDMPEGTLRAILKQAGIEPKEFLQKMDVIDLFSSAPVVESDEERPCVIFDYDLDGNPVGFEILDVSKRVENPALWNMP